jgi:translocation and assembly module TamB
MRRFLKGLTWTLGVLLGVLVILVAVALVGANTQPGRDLIERMVPKLTGGDVSLQGLAGRFPGALRAARVELRDPEGTWLVIDRFALDWAPLRLLIGEALIDRLAATQIELKRRPISSSESSSFSLPVEVTLQSLEVARFRVAPAVAGTEAEFSIDGHARIESLERGSLVLNVRGLKRAGSYQLEGNLNPKSLEVRLKAAEPPDGLVAGIAGLRDVGAITLDGSLTGPRSAVATHLSLDAGPLQAHAEGKLDLVHHAADLRVRASAPAMSPRPEVSWQSVSLAASLSGPFVRPEAQGTLSITDLSAGGAEVRAIAADIQGDAGRVKLHASIDGLYIPGQRPAVLAEAPLVFHADARLDQHERPVTFTLTHPLITARGKAQTAGAMQAAVSLSLPDLAPLAAVAGADVQGHSQWELQAAEHADTTTLDAKGTVGITGGTPPLAGLLGDSARIALSAAVHGKDVTHSRLQVDGKTIHLSAEGGLVAQVAKLNWRLALSDLAVVAPALSGTLQVKGQVDGQTDDFSAKADLNGELATRGMPPALITAHVEAKGLPNAPSGEMTAQGTLAGSPLELAVLARRSGAGATQVDIKRADWKSAHGKGQLALAPGAVFPIGTMELRMTRLRDLEPLIGQPLTGSFTASLQTTQHEGGETRARLSVNARAAGLSGTGAVDKLVLTAIVLNPTGSPVVDGSLVVDGLSVKGVEGSGRLEVKGPEGALAVQLTGDARNVAGGPARLTAAAVVDGPGKKVALSALQASWKGETLRLLSPARVAFANGLSVDALRVGLQRAVLEVSGSISPTLDLTAALRDLSPNVAAAFVPGLNAQGTLRADARLTGSLARPKGSVRLKGSGLRITTGPARSLPAANLTATADLSGETARIDSRLTVGSKTNLSLSGEAPITAAGRLDLRAKGSLDLALVDPILTATGRSVRGQLQLSAAATGTRNNPRLSGKVQLAKGEVQDYAQGVRLKDVNALLQLEGESLRIARLAARAGPGTISASGTVGVLTPGMPIDIRLTANDARPLSSDLLTANLNANLTASGQLTTKLIISGDVHINKAEIRVPETLPTSVATLNVRRRGEKPPPPAAPGPVIGLDLTIEAPRQIYVRGRGLDAELGGRVRVQGTADNPQPIGSFELLRGQFSIAGQNLTISKGKVSFNGGSLTDPSLDFTVSSTNGNITAELHIGGTVSDPKITLSSTPELPQDEVLAQLLFGRSASSLSPFELAQIASALAELTGVTSGGMNPLGSIRQALGLSQLSVGTGATGEPTLEAGRYVSPGVYVGVEQGATAGSTKAKVQVDLTKRLKLEGTVGASSGSATGSSGEGGSSVGVTYQFEY